MNRYTPTDDPNFVETTVSDFGGPDDSQDNGKFAFGGGSVMPDGKINPENYAAFPKALYDKGIVKPGQQVTVVNPKTQKEIQVVARDVGPSAKNRGIDLAPHALAALGASTDDKIHIALPPEAVAAGAHSAPSQPMGSLGGALSAPNFSIGGDLSSANIPAAPLGTPVIGDIPGLPGGPKTLTPIGSGEGEYSAPVVGSTGDVQDMIDQSTGSQPSDAIAPPPPHPDSKGRVLPDGKILFDKEGVIYNPRTDSITYEDGGRTFLAKGGALPKDVTHRKQLVDLTDAKTKEPYKALVDLSDGSIIKKLDDPGSRPGAQVETLRLRMINSAKNQPSIAGYMNVKNNYDSLAQNAAIPPDQRTPADDAAAIQAFGAIEHPGTGVTDADKSQASGLVPWWTHLKIKANNFAHNKSNLLDSNTVNQMRDAAKRALDGRQKTYNEELQPLIEEAKQVGLSPAQVNGALGGHVWDGSPNPVKPSTHPDAPEGTPSQVHVISKDGVKGWIPSTDLDSAQKEGYTPIP